MSETRLTRCRKRKLEELNECSLMDKSILENNLNTSKEMLLNGSKRLKRTSKARLNEISTDEKFVKNSIKTPKTDCKNSQKKYLDTIYEDFVKKGTNTKKIVNSIVNMYKKDKDKALLSVVHYFFRIAGGIKVITLDMLKTMAVPELVQKLTVNYEEQDGYYPIVSNLTKWKGVRKNISAFCSDLIEAIKHEILFDKYFVKQILSILMGMTDSQVRAFRHSSTFYCMKLMTPMVKIKCAMKKKIDLSSQSNSSFSNIENLKRSREDLKINFDILDAYINCIFQGVFVNRYRDSVSDIRSICIAEMERWMEYDRSEYLQDSYLKYIGWLLFDKSGTVRQTALHVLHYVYSDPKNVKLLSLFSMRFKDRFLDMILDKDNFVRVESVSIVTHIIAHSPNLLSDDDITGIINLIYVSQRNLAVAAANFLDIYIKNMISLECDDLDESINQSIDSEGDVSSKKDKFDTFYIKKLIKFLVQHGLPSHTSYFVDSILTNNDQLIRWHIFMNLILGENTFGIKLSDAEEIQIFEILYWSLYQSTTGNQPANRSGQKRAQTAKDQKRMLKNNENFCIQLLPHVEKLILMYSNELSIITNIIKILILCNLDYCHMYTQNISQIFKKIKKTIYLHNNQNLNYAVINFINHLTNSKNIIQDRATSFKHLLIQEFKNNFYQLQLKIKNIYNSSSNKEQQYSELEKLKYDLTSSLNRIKCLGKSFNIFEKNLFECVMFIMDLEFNDKEWQDIFCDCIKICHMSLCWARYEMESNEDGEIIIFLSNNVGRYLKRCILLCESKINTISCEAFSSICDIMIMFRYTTEPDQISKISYAPDFEFQKSLLSFVRINIFDAEIANDVESEDKPLKDLRQERSFAINNKRTCLGGICKIIIYNILPFKHSSLIIKHFGVFYTYYGDIIKDLIIRLRDIEPEELAKSFFSAFRSLYEDCLDFPSVKTKKIMNNLSGHFIACLNVDYKKIRKPIVLIHRKIIFYAISFKNAEDEKSNNLNILRYLVPFSQKLVKTDKSFVLHLLIDNIPDYCTQKKMPEQYESVEMYKKSLATGSIKYREEFDLVDDEESTIINNLLAKDEPS
ncbi:Cohesin subunit SA-3 [Intoshia linei]|uniref:Cohesin subunit SA-3 n=1 Tax=Intoshia linei TaxID=1819745 RepID=A0A177B9W6_9BILA|nr:Cohesin subunit SA-3 [Intoshia linei]